MRAYKNKSSNRFPPHTQHTTLHSHITCAAYTFQWYIRARILWKIIGFYQFTTAIHAFCAVTILVGQCDVSKHTKTINRATSERRRKIKQIYVCDNIICSIQFHGISYNVTTKGKKGKYFVASMVIQS